MLEQPELPHPHRGRVTWAGCARAVEVDYFLGDQGGPKIDDVFLPALPTDPEKLTLEMDDGRKVSFGVLKSGGMMLEGPPIAE